MGVTKIACFCKSPTRLCKRGAMPDGASCFDQHYWSEVREHMERYLSDGICVPNAATTEKVHRKFHGQLAEFLVQLGEVRNARAPDPRGSSAALIKLNQANASILAYAVDLVGGNAGTDAELVDLDIPPVDEEDICMSTARILAVAAGRAAHELIESINTHNEFHIFHHHAVLYDIAQHITRLISEAWVTGSEAYLEDDHPHAMRAREMDAQAAALSSELAT